MAVLPSYLGRRGTLVGTDGTGDEWTILYPLCFVNFYIVDTDLSSFRATLYDLLYHKDEGARIICNTNSNLPISAA
jgi:hypothetical protein